MAMTPKALPAGLLQPASWPWPLPALGAWLLAWLGFWVLRGVGASAAPAWTAGVALGVAAAWPAGALRRRLIAGGGFPLSSLALGLAPSWPAWIWLALALPLLLAYPLRAWRDAPFFPTPPEALDGLDTLLGTPRRVLDAGCGVGHGLAALRRVWPRAELHGVEWSAALAWLAARRCRDAQVRRGDMWGVDWSAFDVVYLFQRPESMARAWDKASRELPAGGWLVSLEFEVPGRTAVACLQRPGRRPVWIYRPSAVKPHSIGGDRRR